MTSTDSHRFVPKAQKEFAKDALEQLKKLRERSGRGGHVTEEEIASCSIIFDSVVIAFLCMVGHLLKSSYMAYAGPKVDIWSCGIILFAMLCAHLPFDDESVAVLFKKIRLRCFKIPTYLSLEVVDLITSMLQVEPVNRVTVEQIKDHEWFLQDLPEYLFPQSDEDSTSDTIDPGVINEVCQKLGVKIS